MTTSLPVPTASPLRIESTTSDTLSVGQLDVGSLGLGPLCSHHWVSRRSRRRRPRSTTLGPGQPPPGRTTTRPPPAESTKLSCLCTASQPSLPYLAQS